MFTRFFKYLKEDRGSIIIMFAFGLPLFVLTIGGGLDYTRSVEVSRNVQTAMDSAALAGLTGFAKNESNNVMEKRARDFFKANFVAKYDEDVDLEVAIDRKALTVTVTADVEVPTTFLHLATIDTLNLEMLSTATGGGQEIVVNIVMCIDATGSMWNTLRAVQANALSFDSELIDAVAQLGRQLDKVYVKPIYYRDYDSDRTPMILGPTYELPEKRQQFRNFVSSQRARGGGDWPEAGLECLHLAMNSDWVKPDHERQQVYPVVAIWTDAAADSPGNWRNIRGYGQYPSGMPRNYTGLLNNWNDHSIINQDNKTGILFGPGWANGWSTVIKWNNFVHAGDVRTGNARMVEEIAKAIYNKLPPPVLSQ